MFQPRTASKLMWHLLPFAGVATILGGSVYWLRRVGLFQAERYWFTNAELVLRSGYPVDSVAAQTLVMRHHESLHELSGWLLLTKYFREAILVAFALLALSQVARLRPRGPVGIAATGLVSLATISALVAAVSGQWFALLAGVRSFAAWGIGLLAPPLVNEDLRRRLGRVCAWTLVCQSAFVAAELQRGLPTYSIHLFHQEVVRVVGTFNLPASLGTFAVAAWATAWCWSGYSRRVLLGLTVLLLAMLVPNASAAAWAALFAVGLESLYRRSKPSWRPVLLACFLPAALIAWYSLPALTGRFDVHDSLWGRILPVAQYTNRHLSASQMLFGTGFALGTNAVGGLETRDFSNAVPDRPVGDSTPAVLFWQVGLVGVGCAYALLAFAMLAKPRSRAIGITIAVSSIALNIGELFPVNLILGMWLADAAVAEEENERT